MVLIEAVVWRDKDQRGLRGIYNTVDLWDY